MLINPKRHQEGTRPWPSTSPQPYASLRLDLGFLHSLVRPKIAASGPRRHSLTHIFISYVRENEAVVEKLSRDLRAAGANVWLDKDHIAPGQRWQDVIHDAIESGSYFLACFSDEYLEKEKSYMNEELLVAVEQLRLRPTHRAWFIPIRLADCQVPNRAIGGGETLRSIQWVDLFHDWDRGITKIKATIQPALRSNVLQSPWLGIRFFQSDQPSTMLADEREFVEVLLRAEPFELRIPRVPVEGWVKLAASYDMSIFSEVRSGISTSDVPFFRAGTGMADTMFGAGNLWIKPEGHMHLDWGGRLLPNGAGGGSVLISTVHAPRLEPPGIPRNKRVFLVVFVGEGRSKDMKNQNFERFTLSFY